MTLYPAVDSLAPPLQDILTNQICLSSAPEERGEKSESHWNKKHIPLFFFELFTSRPAKVWTTVVYSDDDLCD